MPQDAKHVVPLRKHNGSGEVYTRRPIITRFIEESLDWPFEEFIRRASEPDRSHNDYVPSEVLVYYLRLTKRDNSDGRFISVYNILRDRIEAACPRPNRYTGDKMHEDARLCEIRDETVNHVTELMFTDRQGYDEKLDFYEIVFDRAVRSARIDKRRPVIQRERSNQGVEDKVSGEVHTAVEAALERYKKRGLTTEEDLDYRIHLRGAIDALPTDEREVIDLMLADIPIETNKDGEASITELLGCVEKTVRNRRDRAFAKIRRALRLEVDDVQ